jgi:Raf kinase inhibitor-like YbhB/YbcL family protein
MKQGSTALVHYQSPARRMGGLVVKRQIWAGALVACTLLLAMAGCGASSSTRSMSQSTPSPTAPPTATPTPVPMTIVLTSPAFKTGTSIPSQYTCEGANVSPPLAWSHVPQQTASFALTMEDVTGGGFTHWVLFNVPASTRDLPANVPLGNQLASGARQGIDDARVVGYYGPCPALPKGATDDYVFTLYALDNDLPFNGGVAEVQVLDAMNGHILAAGRTDGTYKLHSSYSNPQKGETDVR